MHKSIYIAIYFFLSIMVIWGQNMGQQSNAQIQLRRQMLQQQAGAANILDEKQTLDELLLLEEQFDSTNVPVKIIVTPSELEEFYRLKLSRIRDDIIGLNIIESLLDTVGQLKHFGYDYFYNFEQRELWEKTIPPKNYVLGPGDEIIISMWGQTERREKKIIGRDGQIFINGVGQIKVGGLTLSSAQEYIKNLFSRVYETIKGPAPKTYVDLTHGKISGKTVSFTGQIKLRGYHVVTPYIDAITALIYGGGVDTTGSLRQILFIRDGAPIDTLDLYAYLLDGSPPNQHFMRDGDRLHVPNRISKVTVSGEVRRPGHFELKLDENLSDVIKYAGGLKVNALPQVHLARISKQKNGNIINNYYYHWEDLEKINIKDGDSLSVYGNPLKLDYFFVYGLSEMPIQFPYNKNLTLKNAIQLVNSDAILSNSFKWQPRIKYISENINDIIEIRKIFLDEINFEMKPNDRILFFPNSNYIVPGEIKITGAIESEGIYPVPSHGQSLKSIIEQAGGIQTKSLKNGIHIFRDSLRLGWQNTSMLILPGDSISVLFDQNTIEILGEVNAPGIYEINQSTISIKMALAMAGGLNTNGSEKNVYVVYPNGMVKSSRILFSPKLISGSTLVVGEKAREEYSTTLETTEKLAGIVGSLATLLLVINSTTSN